MLQFDLLATEGHARRGRLTLIRHLLDQLPDTAIDVPRLEFPPLAGKPARERYATLKPIPTIKA